MSILLDGTQGIDFNDGSNQSTAATPYARKNLIINGDMRIDQRNGGASVTPTADSTYTLDRWKARLTQTSKFSVQQNVGSVTPPAGFTNYLGVTSLSAYSVLSSDYFGIQQDIEGFNTANLAYGTANAKTITISFWVRSSLTGTFGGFLANSGANRFYVFSYNISAANTWEQKTVTITGDTTGTWLTNNGIGLQVFFNLGAGSTFIGTAGTWGSSVLLAPTGATSVVGTNGATFYITGCQLEISDGEATPFEHRPYDMELARCQRYLPIFKSSSGSAEMVSWARGGSGGTSASSLIPYLVTPRTAPTGVTTSGAFAISGVSFSTVSFNSSSSMNVAVIDLSGGSGLTVNLMYTLTTTGTIQFTGCEL